MGKKLGKDLLAIAYAAASVMSEGKTEDEINLLAGFFSVLGDALALLSAAKDLCDDDK